MNQITVNFVECEPAPANGYNVQWREAGTFGPYIDAGNFPSSPAVFTDDTHPDGTAYEGIIQSDCSQSGESGSDFGEPVPWSTSTVVDCIGITMSRTFGIPFAHYIDCAGFEQDTIINTNTFICTNGHGFTITGGGITIEGEAVGPC